MTRVSKPTVVLGCSLVLVGGCRADDTAAETAAETSETSSSTATNTSDTSGPGTDTGDESTDTETGNDEECGNGVVEGGEACDDGNVDDTDDCTSACEPAACGDGHVQPGAGEACDLGPANGEGSACTDACQANVCGDGVLGPGEGCDDGNNDDGDGCGANCALPSCGDAIVDAGEACDDGNADDGDACLSTCVEASCGDGAVYVGVEDCDDGPNNADDNACTSTCAAAYCGDGLIHVGVEECDNADMNGPGQLCLAGCIVNVCGDGDKSPVEGCDDGNNIPDDGCTNTCMLPTCGDGIVQAPEDCDDGNNSDQDACLSSCEVASCGDGFVWQGNEACDDGNNNNQDACLSSCEDAGCGDGFVWQGNEACDDGNNNNQDACLSSCEAASCGDSFVWLGAEQCDDGNLVPGDGCEPQCTLTPGQLLLTKQINNEIGLSVAVRQNDEIVVGGRHAGINQPGWMWRYTIAGQSIGSLGGWGGATYQIYSLEAETNSPDIWAAGVMHDGQNHGFGRSYTGTNLNWSYLFDPTPTDYAEFRGSAVNFANGTQYPTGVWQNSAVTARVDNGGNELSRGVPLSPTWASYDAAYADGHVYVAGTDSDLVVLVKYDAALNHVWTWSTFVNVDGMPWYDEEADVAVDPNGHSWVTFRYRAALNNRYVSRIYEIDPNGNMLRDQSLSVGGDFYCRVIEYNPFTSTLVVGGQGGGLAPTNSVIGALDLQANVLWRLNLPNSNGYRLREIDFDSQGMIVAVAENSVNTLLWRMTP